MKLSKSLYLYTASFPYGKGEDFVNNELSISIEVFNNTTIFPYNHTGKPNQLPSNTDIKIITTSSANKLTLRDYFLLFRILFMEFRLSGFRGFFIRKMKKHGSILKQGIKDSKRILDNVDNEIHLSYWNNEWALALAICKMRGNINHFFCRSLGYDIWLERWEGNYQPFREFVYSQATMVFPNSLLAENYLKSKTKYKDKISLSYLGLPNYKLNPIPKRDELHILSISNLIPLKRINKLAEALAEFPGRLTWTHIGDGEELGKIQSTINNFPKDKEVRIISYVESIQKFLETTPVSMFVNCSETEGLPVTIQEALNCGIPVIATDVGGTSELINSNNGILLEKDFKKSDIHEAINRVKEMSCQENLRIKIKNEFNAKFSANRLYSEFYNLIISKF